MPGLTREIAENHALWQNMDVNYVQTNWNKKLYHFVPYKHFISMLQNQTLYFVNIMKAWGDEPYELFYYRPEYYLANPYSRIDVNNVSSRFYAQCWTENRDLDAMWRIYAGKNRDGVRICTTLGEIMQLLYPVRNVNNMVPYVGPMNYMWKKDIKSWLGARSHVAFNDWRTYSRESLFIKRMNFNYEREFRIVLSVPTVDQNNLPNPWEDHISVPVNINSFIKEITLSPFIDDAIKTKQYRRITRYLNGSPIVNQSPLYKNDLTANNIVLN